MGLFEGDPVSAATLGPAETVFEDIVCCQGFKFGAAIVPSQLLASLDLSNCVEVEDTLIVVFDACVGLTAVVDQYSGELHDAVFLHGNLNSMGVPLLEAVDLGLEDKFAGHKIPLSENSPAVIPSTVYAPLPLAF